MATLYAGAFYATASGLLQRVYVPHADDSEIDEQPIGDGESLMTVPIEIYLDGGVPAVQAAIGAPAHSGRCAVISADNGLVLAIILAEPEIYVDPDGNLIIQSDVAVPGDTWDGEQFISAGPH